MKILFCILSLALGITSLRAQSNNKQASIPSQPQGQQGWVQQNSGTTQQLAFLSFPSVDTAYVYAGGGVGALRSVDGGATWQPFATPEVAFLHFLTGKEGYVASFSGRTAYVTRDGGQTWTSADDNDQLVELVCPVTPDTAFLSGSDFVSRTTNGGKSWTTGELNMNNINAIAFADSKHGIVVGNVQPGPLPQHPAQTAGCFTTEDGGVTWVQQYTGAGDQLVGVAFVNPDTIIAVGGPSYMTRSTNGGVSWDSIVNPGGYGAIASKGQRVIAVGGGGAISTSTDGGISWHLEPSGVGSRLASVTMHDESNALAAGVGGVILKTSNGGDSWGQVAPPSLIQLLTRVRYISETPFIEIEYLLPQLQDVSIGVYDITGKEIQELQSRQLETAGEHLTKFNTSQLPSGAYIVRVTTERSGGTGKFLVSR